MNPYEVLGVPRDASPEDVKAAYRRKARQHHSDRGGDDSTMALVNAARDVLADPERRARFDATGDAAGPPPIDVRARNIILDIASRAIENLAESASLVDTIRASLDAGRAQAVMKRAELAAKASKLTKRLARLSGPDEGNLLAGLIEQRLADCARQTEALTHEHACATRALEMLDEYDEAVLMDAGTASTSTFTFRLG